MADNVITTQLDSALVVSALARLSQKAANLRPAMENIGAALVSNILLLFKDGETPEGEKWPALKYRVGQPLRNQGHFMAGITHVAEDSSVAVGPAQEFFYAAIHNFGGEIFPKKGKYLVFNIGDAKVFATKVTIPKRQFMPDEKLPDEWEQDVLDVVTQFLEND